MAVVWRLLAEWGLPKGTVLVRVLEAGLLSAVYWCVVVWLILGAVFSASAYPAQSMFAGFGLAAGLLIRLQVSLLVLFDLCQNRVSGFS